MSFFKSKFFIFCLIVAILLALVPTLIAAFGGTDLLRATMGTVAKPFTMCASGVANAVNGFVNVFTQYEELESENAELREQLSSLENKEYNEKILAEQNEWLKGYINLHSEHPELTLKDARVISREAGNYSTVLTLDKGSIHGVKKNMPVLTEDGLLGYVNEVGLDWCRICTIIEPSSSIAAYIDRTGVLGVIEGSSELRKQGLCRMSYIESDSSVEIGDRVYSAGTQTSIYPSGLLIGYVSSIDIDEDTGELIATVTPAVSFNDINSISGVMIVSGISASKGEE